MKNKDDLTTLIPLKEYTPPELPKLKAVRKNPSILKSLPSRWQNNVKIMSCLGLLGAGMITLASCAGDGIPGNTGSNGREVPHPSTMHHGGAGGVPIYIEGETEGQQGEITIENGEFIIIEGSEFDPNRRIDLTGAVIIESEPPNPNLSYPSSTNEIYIPPYIIIDDLDFRTHFGGSGAGPFYVVYMTEQEAMSIVRSQLETAGLTFGATPPDNTVAIQDDFTLFTRIYKLNLFDDDKNVAITGVGQNQNHWLAQRIADRFEQQNIDASIGVFYTPGLSPNEEWDYEWDWNWSEDGSPYHPTNEEIEAVKEKARPLLEERLTKQIQAFIDFLTSEGIL